MHADDLLSSLDPEQREVATALRGPVRVLAGAGTGKTRAITHRIAYGVAAGVYNPTEVLAVTFTTRAAGEMRTRLRAMDAGAVQARTFHSAALRQVRYFWPKVYGGAPPELTASKIPVVAGAARRNRVEVSQAMLRDLASEIEWAKVSNVRPDDYERLAPRRGREVSGLDAATVAHVFGSYEELKRDQGRMDMEDVLLIGAALLSEDERVAAEVRRQYKWFVVDEFQDVSPIQSALLDLWLGGRDELCVVGDPAQTIYSFAGAQASYLTDFPKRFPGAINVELVRNYRSTPQVIEAANTLLKGSTSTSVQLRAQRAAGPEARLARGHRRGRRGPGRGRRDRPAARRRGAVARDGRAVPDQRPVRGLRGGAHRRRASPTSCAAPPGSSSARRCARRSRCCAVRRGPARRPPTGSSSG